MPHMIILMTPLWNRILEYETFGWVLNLILTLLSFIGFGLKILGNKESDFRNNLICRMGLGWEITGWLVFFIYLGISFTSDALTGPVFYWIILVLMWIGMLTWLIMDTADQEMPDWKKWLVLAAYIFVVFNPITLLIGWVVYMLRIRE